MPDVANVTVGVDLNLAKATQDLRAFTSKKYRFALDNQFSGPLRGITGDIQSFDTSLTKATNRVVAFGAAAAVFKGAQAAFSAFAKATIEVEYSLAAINVNLNESSDGLKKFSADLFGVARQTGQSFETAAKAAEEFARQGLGAEETIKRTRDALILSRIAALDTVSAVNDLTAAVNSFEKEAVGTTDILNKFVALDTRFAVSSKDLADGLQRAGAVAADAGVSLDKFLGIVTAIKQTTGRDGAVIGNALKTIFERTRSPATLKQFEELGVATKDLAGNLLPVDQILKNLADTYDTLSQAQQQQVSKSVANIQQINVFKALLGDLTKAYSVSKQAAQISADATDEALSKNLKLNQTLKAQIESTKTSLTQFFAALGNQDVSGIAKNILSSFEAARKYLSGESGSKLGEDLGNSLLKGLSNVLTGPVAVTALFAFFRAFRKVIQVIGGDVKSLLGLNSIAGQRAEVQSRINDLLKQSTESEYANVRAATTVLEQKRAILAIQERINALSGSSLLTSSFIRPGFLGTKIEGLNAKGKIPSFASVPNFVNPMQGFGKGATLLGKGLFGNVLQNSKRKDLVFKQFTGGFDATQSSGPNSIENEYLASKALEQAGVPVAKVRGSLSRSVARGGLFKEKVDGLEGNDIADSVGYPILNGVIASLKDKVKAAGLEPYDLHGGNFMVKGGVSEEAAALRAGASKEDIIQKLVAKSKIIDPGMFNFKDYTKYDSLKSALTGSSGRKSSEADTFHSPMGTNAFTGERLRSAFPQNFSDPLSAAIGREMAAGVPKHLIYVDKDKRLVSPENPSGLLVANRRDEPVGGFQGINRVLSQGGDPKNAGMMRVPHFADPLTGGMGSGALRTSKGQPVSQETVDAINKLIGSLKGLDSSRIKTVATEIRSLSEDFNKASKGQVTNRILNAQRSARSGEGRIFNDSTRRASQADIDAMQANVPGGMGRSIPLYGGTGFNSVTGERITEGRGGRGLRGSNMRGGGGGFGGGTGPSNIPPSDDIVNRQVNSDVNFNVPQTREQFLDARKAKGRQTAFGRLSERLASGGDLTPAQRQFVRQEIRSQASQGANEVLGPGARSGARQRYVAEQTSNTFGALASQGGRARQAALDARTAPAFAKIAEQEEEARQIKIQKTDTKTAESENQKLARRQRNSSIALGAAFVAPFVAGFIPEGKGGTRSGQALGAVSGALQGAGVGGIFGPIGAGVGAALGALKGAFEKSTKSVEEFATQIDDVTAAQTKVIDSVQRVIGINSQIDETTKSGGSPEVLKRLNDQRTLAIQGIDDNDVRNRVSQGFANNDEQDKFFEQLNKKSFFQQTQGNVQNKAFSSGQDNTLTKFAKFIDSNPLGKFGSGGLVGPGLTTALEKAGKEIELLNFSVGDEAKTRKDLSSSILKTLTSGNTKNINRGSLITGLGNDAVDAKSIKALSEQFKQLGYEVNINEKNYKQFNLGLLDATKQFDLLDKESKKYIEAQSKLFLRGQQSQSLNSSQGLFSTLRGGVNDRAATVANARGSIAAQFLNQNDLSDFNAKSDVSSLELKRRTGLDELNSQFTNQLKTKALSGPLDENLATNVGKATDFSSLEVLLKKSGQSSISIQEVSKTAQDLSESQAKLNTEIDDAIQTRKAANAVEKTVAKSAREFNAFRGAALGGNETVSALGGNLRYGQYNARTPGFRARQLALSVSADKELEGLGAVSQDSGRQQRRVKNSAQADLNAGYEIGAQFLERRTGGRYHDESGVYKQSIERSLLNISRDKAFDQDTRDKASDILAGIKDKQNNLKNPQSGLKDLAKQDPYADLKKINSDQSKLISETVDLFNKFSKEIANGNRDIVTKIQGEIKLSSDVLSPDVLADIKQGISESIQNVIDQRLRALENDAAKTKGKPNPPGNPSTTTQTDSSASSFQSSNVGGD